MHPMWWPLYVMLSLASVTDVRFRRIPHGYSLGVLGWAGLVWWWRCWPLYGQSALLVVGLLIVMLGVQHLKAPMEPFLGGGDIKLITACAFFIPLDRVGLWIACMGGFGLLYGLITRQSSVPLAPAIALSFVVITMNL